MEAATRLKNDLNPSTSKEYVLPRCDQTLFANRFVTDSNGFQLESGPLKQFYRLEQFYRPSSKYFECVQTEINVDMRKILVQWMHEVCDEEGCSLEIFPLAVSYLDRFLSVQTVHKHQLQALGAACLFLASKVKEPLPFSAERLEKYTDESVSVSDLLSWELLLLGRLDWDVAALTPFDFLDQFLPPQWIQKDEEWRMAVNVLVAQSAMDFDWATRLPSEIAHHVCLATTGKQPSEMARQMYIDMVMSSRDSPSMSPSDTSHIQNLCIHQQSQNSS